MRVEQVSEKKQSFNGLNYYLCGNHYYQRKGKRLHCVVWEHYNGKIPKGYQIHHIDGDRYNNNIENLELVSRSEHARYHARKRMTEMTPEAFQAFHSKGIEAAKSWHKSPEGRAWHKAHSRGMVRKRHKKDCMYCGGEYETTQPTVSKFCSGLCRTRNTYLKRTGKRIKGT